MSPTTCQDWGLDDNSRGDYETIDGVDEFLDFGAMIASTRLNISNNGTIIIADSTAANTGDVFQCDDLNGCHYNCTSSAACFQSIVHCRSPVGCHFVCKANFACSKMTIYANTDVPFNESTTTTTTLVPQNTTAAPSKSLDPTLEPTLSPIGQFETELHIECYQDSCEEMKIYAGYVSSVHIHCYGDEACSGMQANFQNITSENNTETSISCYTQNACPGLHIKADGRLTQLHMYNYSENIILDNGYGWSFDDDTITCDLDSKYIKYDFGYSTDDDTYSSIEALVRYEYKHCDYINKDDDRVFIPDSVDDPLPCLPCEGITVQCLVEEANGTYSNGSCRMQYVWTPESSFDSAKNRDPFTKKAEREAHCTYVSLRDALNLQCIGNCQGSPTEAPTTKPSLAPTQPPSLAPSLAPTYSPSLAPTQPPSMAPSLAPSFSPSLAPTFSPSLAPTQPPTLAPSLAPTYSPSLAPTYSPTEAPTRSPHSSHGSYNAHTLVVYRFINMTYDDLNWVYNWTSNGVIDKIQVILEEMYFDAQYLPYEWYRVVIELINRMDYKDKNQWNLNRLYEQINPHTNLIEMHVRCSIDHIELYQSEIGATSADPAFWNRSTQAFRTYFDNEYLNFTTANGTFLEQYLDPVEESDDIAFWALNGVLGLCVLIGVAARFHNKRGEDASCKPVDNANWIAIMLYGLQIYDVVSDINLTTEIFTAIIWKEGNPDDEFQYWANDGNEPGDDPKKFDTLKEYALLAAGIMSLTFLVVPYGLNVAYASKIPNHVLIRNNPCARTWFEQYQSLFISLVVFSGGCYPAMALTSSNLFAIPILNSGLSTFELTALSDIRVVTTVLTENGPQLLVQLLFSYAINKFTQNTLLAFATSIMSIVASILNYCINKDKAGQAKDIYYYFQIKLKPGNEAKLSDSEKKIIKLRRNLRAKLAKKIIKIYGDIDIASFEIGYVTIRNDNFVVRICQHVHAEDLTKTGHEPKDEDELLKITNIKNREKEELQPFKLHCQGLYQGATIDVQDAIFEHFEGIDKNKFGFTYHMDYPKEKNASKLLDKKNRAQNFQDLIKNKSIDMQFSMEMDLENMDLTNQESIDFDEEYWEKEAQRMGKTIKNKDKDKDKDELIGGDVAKLQRHRKQFKASFKKIKEHIDKKKEKNPYYTVGTAQIQEFIGILHRDGVQTDVIQDVLHFATEAGTFTTEEKEEKETYRDNKGKIHTDPWEIKRAKMRDEAHLVTAWPDWFVATEGKPKPKKDQDIDFSKGDMWTWSVYHRKNFETVEVRDIHNLSAMPAQPDWFIYRNGKKNYGTSEDDDDDDEDESDDDIDHETDDDDDDRTTNKRLMIVDPNPNFGFDDDETTTSRKKGKGKKKRKDKKKNSKKNGSKKKKKKKKKNSKKKSKSKSKGWFGFGGGSKPKDSNTKTKKKGKGKTDKNSKNKNKRNGSKSKKNSSKKGRTETISSSKKERKGENESVNKKDKRKRGPNGRKLMIVSPTLDFDASSESDSALNAWANSD